SEKDCKGVVHEAPREIELDAVDRFPTDVHHGEDTSQRRPHEDHICGRLRDIRAFIHVNANRSLCESDSIVRAVTAENNNWFPRFYAGSEERLDVVLLVGGRASRTYIATRDVKL